MKKGRQTERVRETAIRGICGMPAISWKLKIDVMLMICVPLRYEIDLVR